MFDLKRKVSEGYIKAEFGGPLNTEAKGKRREVEMLNSWDDSVLSEGSGAGAVDSLSSLGLNRGWTHIIPS
jgi:hypothetical protein